MRMKWILLIVLVSCIGCAAMTDWMRSPSEPSPVPPPPITVETPSGETVTIQLPPSEEGETKGQHLGRAISENGSKFPGPIGLGLWFLGQLIAGASAPKPKEEIVAAS